MQVYSTPITPPPTTIMVFGRFTMSRIRSELMIDLPLIGTFALEAGLVPVAISTFLLTYSVAPREFAIFNVVDSGVVETKLAVPTIISMLLRCNCASVTSISVLMTCCTRKARSAIVMRSLTR